MKATKRKKLEEAGWTVGTAEDFLQLSEEEAAYVELRLLLSRLLKETRRKQKLTQAVLARRIGSSQSRVAKMEAGDATVKLDLLIKSVLAMGISRQELGEALTKQ
jgi:DNA-binding XRE family transcriptional regulator